MVRIDYFRITDIAKKTGIDEEQVRRYTGVFDEFLTYATEGDQKLYTPDVLLLITRIHEHCQSGKSVEEVRDALEKEFPQLREQKNMKTKETACCDENYP